MKCRYSKLVDVTSFWATILWPVLIGQATTNLSRRRPGFADGEWHFWMFRPWFTAVFFSLTLRQSQVQKPGSIVMLILIECFACGLPLSKLMKVKFRTLEISLEHRPERSFDPLFRSVFECFLDFVQFSTSNCACCSSERLQGTITIEIRSSRKS
jgi:hypothetical protein